MDDFLFSLTLGLNQQRNGLSLNRYVLEKALPRLLPESQIKMFEVFSNEKTEEQQDSHSLVFRCIDFHDQRIDQRIDIEKLARFSRESSRSFFSGIQTVDNLISIPVSSDLGPMRLVYINDFPEDPIIRTRVLQMVEVFVHQVNLVDDMERDQLTSLLNRKSFNVYYQSQLDRLASKSDSLLWLAVMDIDHFKRVNDTYGHLYGDEVLLHFSRLMEQNFRYKDIPFRFGGEEFVLLLETSGIDDVQPVLDRFRKVVESYDFPGVGKVTVSIGYTKCEQNTLPTTLIDHADKALYFAKENGRNRVVSYNEIPEAEPGAGDNNVDLF